MLSAADPLCALVPGRVRGVPVVVQELDPPSLAPHGWVVQV